MKTDTELLLDARLIINSLISDMGYEQSDGYMDGQMHSTEYNTAKKFLNQFNKG